MQRDALATMVAAVEHKIQERRQQLDGAKRADFDLARGLSESRFQLDQLVRQREQVENAPAAPVVIESYPTPISRAVDGPEAHLLVANGRVVFIPVGAALGAVCQRKPRCRPTGWPTRTELTETVGPVGGFRLRYTLERQDDVARDDGNGPRRQLRRLQRWTLIPDLGRPGRAGAAGLGAGLGFPPGAGEDPARPDGRSPSGSIPTASTPSGRFARSCTG